MNSLATHRHFYTKSYIGQPTEPLIQSVSINYSNKTFQESVCSQHPKFRICDRNSQRLIVSK